MNGHTGFLQGMTVLDLSTVGPAARATRLLADYGAEVVKVGPVPGLGAEPIRPPTYAYGGHRFMTSVAIDLKDERGVRAFLDLAREADVVVESFRPGVVDRLGIGFTAVRAVNPTIVYCSTSGYGQKGARSSWAGHDLDYLAVGGFLASAGPRADGGPPLPGATIADGAGGGMHAAMAVMAALVGQRSAPWRSSGHDPAVYLDVSAADGVLWLMSLAVDEALATGAQPGPGHDVLSGRYACYDTYRARDGKWLAVGAIESKFFSNLCAALGLPQWADRQYDDGAQDGIRSDFAGAFATRDRDAWVADLAGDDTCVAPVLTVTEVAADPALVERGAFVRAASAAGGTFRQTAPVLAGMERPPEPVELPDTSSTCTATLLEDAGYPPSVVEDLRRNRVIA